MGSLYQNDTVEGTSNRATERVMKAREWLGNVTSKPIDRFVLEDVRKRLRHSLAMNVPKRQAIPGKILEGPWHMTKSIASCVGMANAWLAEQGVLNLKSFWAELAHLH